METQTRTHPACLCFFVLLYMTPPIYNTGFTCNFRVRVCVGLGACFVQCFRYLCLLLIVRRGSEVTGSVHCHVYVSSCPSLEC